MKKKTQVLFPTKKEEKDEIKRKDIKFYQIKSQ